MILLLRRQLAALTLASVGLVAAAAVLTGQEPRPAPSLMIQSLSEPGQGLAVQTRSPGTGLVTFASGPGRGILLPGMAGAPAESRALAFVEQYGIQFGIGSRVDVRPVRTVGADPVGQEHVRLQQVLDGIPVTAGELIVHLLGDRVVAANGHTLSEVPSSLSPEIAPGAAQQEARTLIEKIRPGLATSARYAEPRLEIFNRGMIDEGVYPTRLAWFVEATDEGLREYIWVDAQTGGVLLNFSQIADARNRVVYDVALGTTLPGTLVRLEGGPPVGVVDANLAYDFAGSTYDYFFANHGRDSYDGAGASIVSSVRYRQNPGAPFQNAFWNGTQMVYGEGFASADDVVAHELTHAVTEFSAGLLYYNQSGALNESYSDIFGEVVDLTDGLGNDTPGVRWQLAEDLSIGAIRNMMSPTLHGDPGKLSDPQFVCRSDAWTSQTADNGGVHSNSGVPNHAFALMVDGGTYNGQTVSGIGIAKAAAIHYRALTTYLTSGSGFLDNSTALTQSCGDLIGTGGITGADCAQVATALVAVEMANPLPCTGATPPPATFCPLGGSPSPVFSDGFETGGGSWTTSDATRFNLINEFARTGVMSVYGVNGPAASDHQWTMTSPVTIPAAGRMSFDHAFEFEHASGFNFDGGVLEYSTDGTSWNDAGALVDAGHAYNGTIYSLSGNVLANRSAFVRSSFGYTGTRLNLSTLAGQSVRFRFRVGTDFSVGSLGWIVDNVSVYSCTSATVPTTENDAYATPFQTVLQVAAPGVLANDNSNGGGAMTAALVSGTANGVLALGADGGFSYTPNAGFSGTDTFTYRASNASGPGSIATVSIGVAGGVPTTVTDAYATPFQTVLQVAAPGVLANDNSNGGGAMTAALVSGTANGVLALGADGGFSYTPNAGFSGTDTFTYRASNASGPGNIATVSIDVGAAPTTAQPPTGLYVSSVAGNLVTVRWTPPAFGLPPTGYRLEGGVSPGQVLASLPIPGGAPIYTFAAPTGQFLIRVHTISDASRSGPSNEIPLVVNVPVAPSAPASLLGLVNGTTLTLAWRNTFGGGAPTTHVLDVSGSITAALPIGPGNSFSFAGVPAGTYTLSLRAANGGGSSASSNPVTLTFPGPCSGAPLTPENFIAYKAGHQIFATWDPAASGPAPTSFVLSVTGSFVGAIPLGGRSISGLVGPGTYNLSVGATNPCGSSAPTAAQVVTVP